MSSDLLASDVTPLTRLEGRSRRKLSITIGLILGFLVVSFYAVTIVRLKGNVAKRFEPGATAGAGQVIPAPANAKTTQDK